MKVKDLRERDEEEKKREVICFTFIWVRRFWNQNLTWRGFRPSSWLSLILCLSSGCGHSLNMLQNHVVKRGN